MPVVHNFTTIQKMQHDDARDIVEYIQAKSVIDDKIERNDMQDEIQSEKDHTNPVVQELAVREEEAERQALEDKFKRDNNVPVNESKELDRLRKKYRFIRPTRPNRHKRHGLYFCVQQNVGFVQWNWHILRHAS